MDRLLAPPWRQVGPHALAARVPPLSMTSLAHLRACLCQPLPLHARASDGARAGTKGAPDLYLHAAAACAASRARQRRRGRLERPRLGPLPRWRTDGQPPRRGCSSCLTEHLEALSAPISTGIGGWRRDDEQPAAEDGGGGGGGLVAHVDGAARGGASGERARAAAARGWRWRGARPQTRRQRAPGPRAPRRPSRAHAGGCARAICVSSVCVVSLRACGACGGRADRRAASAARSPRVMFAFGHCKSVSAYKFRSHGPRTRTQM